MSNNYPTNASALCRTFTVHWSRQQQSFLSMCWRWRMTRLPLEGLNAIWSSSILFLLILQDNTQDTMPDLCLSHPLLELEMFPQLSSYCCAALCIPSLPTHLNHIFLCLRLWWINSLPSLPWVRRPCLGDFLCFFICVCIVFTFASVWTHVPICCVHVCCSGTAERLWKCTFPTPCTKDTQIHCSHLESSCKELLSE